MKRIQFLLISLCMGYVANTQAALFEDTEARKFIISLSEQLKNNQKVLENNQNTLENNQNALVELSLSNDRLKSENQALLGKLEELQKSKEELTENLKRFYADLNERIKKLEPTIVEVEGLSGPSQPGEKEAYDNALKHVQSGESGDAIVSFNDFITRFPKSPYWPLAKFWLANMQYVQKDYKSGIATAQSLIKRYPDHPRVPEALLTIADCQIESGQKADAKKTLAEIMNKYPDSKSANSARTSLSKLK